jgi:hypothetical protein
MADNSRQKWLKTLGIIAQKRPDEAEAEWAWVMKALGLGPDYFLAVHEAVRQGRWREAEDPGHYLKTVVKREARGEVRLRPSSASNGSGLGSGRLGPGEAGGGWRRPGRWSGDDEERELRRVHENRSDYGEEMTLGRQGPVRGGDDYETSEDRLDYLGHRQDRGEPAKDEDGVWRSGAGWGALHERGMKKPERRRKPIKGERPLVVDARKIKPLDPYYQTYVGPEPERAPDWAKMSAEAGLSDWEKKVVEYQMSGMGWREAAAAQPDEESRRALIAAWRSMERTGLKRLREAVKKSFAQDVAKEGDWDTE